MATRKGSIKKIASVTRSLSLFQSLFIATFFLAVGGLAIGVSRHDLKIARLIVTMKPSPVAAAPDAFVALEGRAKAMNGQMLVASATRTPCLWFRVIVGEFTSNKNDPDNPKWTTLSEYSSTEPFLIQDATGEFAVYPSKAEITPTDRSRWAGMTAIPQDRNPLRVRQGDSFPLVNDAGKAYFYTEERIYDGDPLYALGTLQSQAVVQPEQDEAKDDSGAAQPEDEDWRLAPPADQRRAVKNGGWLGRSRFKELDRIARSSTSKRLIATNPYRPFILSAISREELLKATLNGSKAALIFAAFPIGLALAFLWFRFVVRPA